MNLHQSLPEIGLNIVQYQIEQELDKCAVHMLGPWGPCQYWHSYCVYKMFFKLIEKYNIADVLYILKTEVDGLDINYREKGVMITFLKDALSSYNIECWGETGDPYDLVIFEENIKMISKIKSCDDALIFTKEDAWDLWTSVGWLTNALGLSITSAGTLSYETGMRCAILRYLELISSDNIFSGFSA